MTEADHTPAEEAAQAVPAETQDSLPVRPRRRPRIMLSRANQEKATATYRHCARFAHVILTPWGKRDYRGVENLPLTGGVLVVGNHISQFDPIVTADCLIWNGRWPRFLSKISLFKSKLVGWLLRATESVPVDRGTVHAADSLIHAKERLEQGKCVILFPEGTETHDPDIWPMMARTGAARLALTTDVPVVPFGQWGAHKVLGPKDSPPIPRRYFGQRFQFLFGTPIDFSDLKGLPITKPVLEVATSRIMDAVTALVAEIRQETPPEDRWDRKLGQRVPQLRSLEQYYADEPDDPA